MSAVGGASKDLGSLVSTSFEGLTIVPEEGDKKTVNNRGVLRNSGEGSERDCKATTLDPGSDYSIKDDGSLASTSLTTSRDFVPWEVAGTIRKIRSISRKVILVDIQRLQKVLDDSIKSGTKERDWEELSTKELNAKIQKVSLLLRDINEDCDEIDRSGGIRFPSKDIRSCYRSYNVAITLFWHLSEIQYIAKAFSERAVEPVYIPLETYRILINLFDGSVVDSGKQLGAGCYGTVREVRLGSKSYARKLFKRGALDNHRKETFSSFFLHPSYGATPIYLLENPIEKLSILMPLAKEDCFGEFAEVGVKDPINTALEIVDTVLKTLRGLSRFNLSHNDIKMCNVLHMPKGDYKLADFGATALINTERGKGTIAAYSPEKMKGDPHNQKSDMWALGVMIFGFLNNNMHLTKKMYGHGYGSFAECLIYWYNLQTGFRYSFKKDKNLSYFYNAVLTENPTLVKEFIQVQSAKIGFTKEIKKLLNGLLAYDPKDRMSLEQATKAVKELKLFYKAKQIEALKGEGGLLPISSRARGSFEGVVGTRAEDFGCNDVVEGGGSGGGGSRDCGSIGERK